MSAVEAAATLNDYIDMWTHRKITPSSYVKPPASADPQTTAAESDDLTANDDQRSAENPATDEESFEYVEGEDANLPWKCAACEFIDPAKHVVVEHWQRCHCSAQV